MRRWLRLREKRGSVAVETALVLPFLCLLVVGGWVLGYLAYTKVALAMVANRAARDLAADPRLFEKLHPAQQPFRYDGGFSESFGLPRWGLHAVAMKLYVAGENGNPSKGGPPPNHAVIVAVCYRVPFTVPFSVANRPELPRKYLGDTRAGEEFILDVADLADLVGEQELNRALTEAVEEFRTQKAAAEAEMAAWDELIQRGEQDLEGIEDLVEKMEWAGQLVQRLIGREPPDMQKYGKRTESKAIEKVVATLCEPPERLKGDSIVLTSRASYVAQEFFSASKDGGGQFTGGKGKGAKGR